MKDNMNKYTESPDDKKANIKKELDDDLFEKEMPDKRDKRKQKCPDMSYLETEEEAAENIANIYERRDYTRKKEYDIDVNGLDRDGYNINGIDKNGSDRDGYNICY